MCYIEFIKCIKVKSFNLTNPICNINKIRFSFIIIRIGYDNNHDQFHMNISSFS